MTKQHPAHWKESNAVNGPDLASLKTFVNEVQNSEKKLKRKPVVSLKIINSWNHLSCFSDVEDWSNIGVDRASHEQLPCKTCRDKAWSFEEKNQVGNQDQHDRIFMIVFNFFLFSLKIKCDVWSCWLTFAHWMFRHFLSKVEINKAGNDADGHDGSHNAPDKEWVG